MKLLVVFCVFVVLYVAIMTTVECVREYKGK